MLTSPPEKPQSQSATRTERLERLLNRVALPVTAAFLLAYFLPYLLLWDNAYFLIHDNLDAEYAQLKLLAQSGKLLTFGNPLIANVFDGVPRSLFRSPLDFTALFFAAFDAHAAYIINHVVTHTIGFVGMYLLLTRHWITAPGDRYIAAGTALAFAFLPFYSILGASISAQPLLLDAFLNIRAGKFQKRSFLVVFLFPFYANLVMAGPFVLVALGLLLLVDAYRKHTINLPFLGALALLVCVYVAVNIPLIASVFSGFVSHRSEWPLDIYGALNVRESFFRARELFFLTQYHAGQFQTYLILLAFALAFALRIIRKQSVKLPLGLIAIITLICFFYGFYTFFVHAFAERAPLLLTFQAHRFYILLPLLWLMLFALALSEIGRVPKFVPFVLILLLGQLYLITFSPSSGAAEFKNNVKLLSGREIYQPTHRQYHAEKLFEEVAAFIGKPKSEYRVVSLGMPPSVTQFNGFYTLDSYQANYALEYKQRFRRIIEKELAKDEGLRRYYDNWGSRVYIFSSELGHNWLHVHTKVVRNLQLDPVSLRELGAKYLLSAVPIENATQNSLQLLKTFRHPNSWWTVRLYQVH
jgi:hypothetical protein